MTTTDQDARLLVYETVAAGGGLTESEIVRRTGLDLDTVRRELSALASPTRDNHSKRLGHTYPPLIGNVDGVWEQRRTVSKHATPTGVAGIRIFHSGSLDGRVDKRRFHG